MAFRTRSRAWSICIGPGVTAGLVGAGGVNLYKFRNDTTGEVFNFAHLVLGAGASLNISGIKALGTLVKGLLQSFESLFNAGSNLSAATNQEWLWLDVETAFSGHDLDWSSAAFSKLGGGVGAGLAASVLHGYGRMRVGASYGTRDMYYLRQSGSSAELGLGTFSGGGPMVSVGFY